MDMIDGFPPHPTISGVSTTVFHHKKCSPGSRPCSAGRDLLEALVPGCILGDSTNLTGQQLEGYHEYITIYRQYIS